MSETSIAISDEEDNVNNIEKIRVLKAGLEAACRWPYDDMGHHVKGMIITVQELAKNHYSEEYIADVRAIRRALAVRD